MNKLGKFVWISPEAEKLLPRAWLRKNFVGRSYFSHVSPLPISYTSLDASDEQRIALPMPTQRSHRHYRS